MGIHVVLQLYFLAFAVPGAIAIAMSVFALSAQRRQCVSTVRDTAKA